MKPIIAQIRDHVIVPTLAKAQSMNKGKSSIDGDVAQDLLLSTIAAESGAEYIAQFGGGPARGIFQMEPETLEDLVNVLQPRHADKFQMLQAFCPPGMKFKDALYGVLPFQVIACRLQYWRHPDSLPLQGDKDGLWVYYKRFWNTEAGDTTRQEYDERCKAFLER